jgi:hypothetical protein
MGKNTKIAKTGVIYESRTTSRKETTPDSSFKDIALSWYCSDIGFCAV